MIDNNDKLFKKECDSLAELLHSNPDQVSILQGLFRLSLLQSKQIKPTPKPIPSTVYLKDKIQQIGIWKATSGEANPEYLRDPNTDPLESGMWADCERIPPKTYKQRIVFLGESVARGFFFEPYFSPASVLVNLINQYQEADFEVVDLARSDLGLSSLRQLLHDSLILKPDFILIFAGNNWVAYGKSIHSHTQELAEAIKPNCTMRKYIQRLQDIIRNEIDEFMQQCQQIQQEQNIPVFLMIPEFNLADYYSNTRYAQPYMPSKHQLEWRILLHSAESAIQQSHVIKAKKLLERAVQLDEETSPVPLSLLAQIALNENNQEQFRMYCEKVKDAEIWHRLTTPRCYGFIVEHLREYGNEFGLRLIDLPLIFQQFNPNAIPDRQLFFDYCHLTETGIQVAMSSAANSIYHYYTGKTPTLTNTLNLAPKVSQSLKARAYLLAAIHNASWGQPKEIIYYQCETAFKTDPIIYQQLNQWTKIAGIPVPPYMTKSFHQAWDSGDLILLHKLATLGPYLYTDFSNAYEQVLQITAPEQSTAVQIQRTHHNFALQDIDLLETYYSIQSWSQPEAFLRKDFGFFRSYSMVSQFEMYCSPIQQINIILTVRIPNSTQILEPLKITCNQHQCFEINVSNQWQTVQFSIAEQVLQSGLNQIKIHWPPFTSDSLEEFYRIKKLFLKRNNVQFYVPCGDIYSFRASKLLNYQKYKHH